MCFDLFKGFVTKKRGYSMVVLVIAIIVIIILTAVSVATLQGSRRKTELINFISDMNTIQDYVYNYYSKTGTLPTRDSSPTDIYDIANEVRELNDYVDQTVLLGQLSEDDNENYYDVDLAQLGGISLKNAERGYFMNEASLKVYVRMPVNGSDDDSDRNTKIFFTLTPALVNGQENYVPVEEELLILGNPMTWTNEAKLRVILPKYDISGDSHVDGVYTASKPFNNWTFMWDSGPKSGDEIKRSSNAKEFKYGDTITIKSNGVYTFFVDNNDSSDRKTILKNVNITKIDDIKPRYIFSDNGNIITATDDQTGIKKVKFKTLEQYKLNVEEAKENNSDLEARTQVDFYLMGGDGKDVVYQLEPEIEQYINNRRNIMQLIDQENDEFDRWLEEAEAIDNELIISSDDIADKRESHTDTLKELNRRLEELNAEYSYLYDIYGSSDASRLVIYIEDYAGNGVVVGDVDFISTEIIAKSYNISLAGLE